MHLTRHRVIRLCLCCLLAFPALAQQQAMTVEQLAGWQRITQQALSDNGQWAACRFSPWRGDASVHLFTARGETVATYAPAEAFAFSSSSEYLLVEKVPAQETLDSLAQRRTAAEERPMHRLLLRDLSRKREETIDSLRCYRLAEKAELLAYQCGRKDSTLRIRSLDGTRRWCFPGVTAFGFAPEGGNLYFIAEGAAAGLYRFTPASGEALPVKAGKGAFKQPCFDKRGEKLAFLYAPSPDSLRSGASLWLSEGGAAAKQLVGRGDEALPAGWVVSEWETPSFSESGTRLFFGTAPAPFEKDTTLPDERRPHVQVWSWDEPVPYTVQQYRREQDLKKSYRALYDLTTRRTLQLATEALPDITLTERGEGEYALLSTARPYSLPAMWEGRTRRDYVILSLKDGSRRPLSRADYRQFRLSPAGKYAYAYVERDSSWYTVALADNREYRLTTPRSFAAWDEENDVPDHPSAYGAAGWSAEDSCLFLYDRYDLWRFHPAAATAPLRLTTDGRENRRRYRLLSLERETYTIDDRRPALLQAFDERTKGSGYYATHLDTPAAPRCLLAGAFRLNTPLKARQADTLLYTAESYTRYPDLLLSDLRFQRSRRLTHGDRQQAGLRWGTAELVSWLSLDGERLEGVLYKPADFDPSRKYPLLVNFYERNAETLHTYHHPEPHRSTIDYRLYNSHEYLIFNPDVRYREGYPGESCYNCVMPGIAALLAQGFVDERAIGAQGHSWGGYQVAYLATRTTLFAAIEAGAPVVNMFSAYGGIRWGSGMSRAFQYEHRQSRLGGTPWSAPIRYWENSPLFLMDRVETPILIMHNDADGHVPWSQGIEYFIALKRLHKPAWLLNYPGEPHWPLRMANKVDFQKRMFQFFEHYLKRRPMPAWMAEGLPAVKQEETLGY